jgi:hypothetical protein
VDKVTNEWDYNHQNDDETDLEHSKCIAAELQQRQQEISRRENWAINCDTASNQEIQRRNDHNKPSKLVIME